ncbi:MAG: type II secretion system protein [Nocardioidaceae bacterium]
MTPASLGLLSALTVAVAVALWARPSVSLPSARPAASVADAPRRWSPFVPWLAIPAAVFLLHGRWIAVGLIGALAAVAVLWLVRRGQARKRADALRLVVVEACEAVASELRAGRTPTQALARGAELWPGLASPAAAAELDADVPGAFRLAARTRGAETLLGLAAYWQLSAETGSGLADAVERAADQARSHLAARRLVARELAGAQATARMVVLLPVVITVLSQGSGSDPVGFLSTTLPGLACLALGLAFGLGGLAWIEAIVASVERECGR